MNTTMEYEIWIPRWKPALLNELTGNRGKAMRLKASDRKMIDGYCRLRDVPKASGRRRVSLEVIVPPGRGGLPDEDALWKSLLDGLKQAGMLVNDSPKWCQLGTVIVRRPKKVHQDWTEMWGTRILLEDLDGSPARSLGGSTT